MSDEPPPGYTARPARKDDAAAALDVVATNNTRVIGEPDVTLDDIVDEPTDPDPHHDLLLVHDPHGRVAAYALSYPNGPSAYVGVAFYLRTPEHAGIGPALLRGRERRAAQLGAERGRNKITVTKGCYRQDTVGATVMRDAGYTVATTYHRMRRDLDGSERPPTPPAGVTIRRADGGDAFRHTVYLIREEAFVGHHGWTPRPYQEWLAARDASATTDWSQLWLADIDGTPVAALVGDNRFVADQNCGFVLTLATRPPYRGCGLGRLLLHTYFAYAADRKLSGVLLGVDTQNTTGALGLYESVGMRPVVETQAWERRLATR